MIKGALKAVGLKNHREANDLIVSKRAKSDLVTDSIFTC
jgi:hypothetical protein